MAEDRLSATWYQHLPALHQKVGRSACGPEEARTSYVLAAAIYSSELLANTRMQDIAKSSRGATIVPCKAGFVCKSAQSLRIHNASIQKISVNHPSPTQAELDMLESCLQ